MALPLGSATGPAKLKAVTSLVDKLTKDLDDNSLSTKERDEALEELKTYGRDPQNADPIFTKDGISMLLRYGFESQASETSRGALRVLANAMLLKPETRKLFVDLGYALKASEKLEADNWDDEFLVARILFFSTYGAGVDLPLLIDEHRLAEHITHNLKRHAELLRGQGSEAEAEPMEQMALGETLRLMFNVTHFHKECASRFTPAIPDLVTLLWKPEELPQKPLAQPLGSVINALLNLNLDEETSKDSLFPKKETDKLSSRLVKILGLSMSAYGENELDASVTPLVSLLIKVYECAPKVVKQFMRDSLLPTAADREDVLGRGQNLPAKLLKNSTSPLAPHFRDAISHLLFNMSDQDSSKFVENVGYGYASGFLFKNCLHLPPSVTKNLTASDSRGSQKPINPITGQFLDTESPADLPEMTDEEKEREAERLFVLFERLKNLGIVDVRNPVEEAVESGKFRELDDNEVEELD